MPVPADPDRKHFGFLVKTLTQIADGCATLADRREALLLALAERVSADAGHWAWGKAVPEQNSLVVVAHIPFGFSVEELTKLQEFGMCAEHNREFQLPQLPLLRADGMICAVRRDTIPDARWTPDNLVRKSFNNSGNEEWLNVVRCSQNDTWSQFLMLRKIGRPAFERADLDLVDLALSTIPWLWATAEETLPPAKVVGLTPRQRMVTLHLLSGLSRKMIAQRLKIAEPTVNDHVNAVFKHFQVSSATELAAIFLRSR